MDNHQASFPPEKQPNKLVMAICNFFTVKTRPDVNRWWRTCYLFIIAILGQQVAVVVYSFFHALHADLIGIIAGLLVAWMFAKIALSYKSNRDSLGQSVPHTGRIIAINIGILYAATIGWGVLGPKLLGLNMSNNATSDNQSAILSFLTNSWSTIFIIALTVIVAPMLEEFAFRYLIIKPTKTKHNKLRMAVSLISFPLMHVYSQIGQVFTGKLTPIAWLFYFGQYFLIAIMLVYTYNKYHNYKLNVLCHASWNMLAMAIAIIGQILTSK